MTLPDALDLRPGDMVVYQDSLHIIADRRFSGPPTSLILVITAMHNGIGDWKQLHTVHPSQVRRPTVIEYIQERLL